jgi:hypothetical protein
MKPPPAGWEWCVKEEWGIKLRHPPNWKAKEEKDKVIFKDSKHDRFSFTSRPIGKDFDLAWYAARPILGKKEKLEDIVVGGEKGKMAKGKVFVPGEPNILPTKNVWVTVVHKERVFQFIFAEVELDEERTEINYKVLYSVEFF